jgi:hypothetical protein
MTFRRMVVLAVLMAPVLARPAHLSAVGVADVQTQNGNNFLTGGFGKEERAAVQALIQRFNLRMTLTATHGKYLGEATVHIQDTSGHTVLEAPANGPLFYIQLKPATYVIRVSHGGTDIQKTAHLAGGRTVQMGFRFSEE